MNWYEIPHRIGLAERIAMALARPGVVVLFLIAAMLIAVALADSYLPAPSERRASDA